MQCCLLVCRADDFQLTASMSLLKLVIDLSSSSSSSSSGDDVEAAVPCDAPQFTTVAFHVDDSAAVTTHAPPSDDVDDSSHLQLTDDVCDDVTNDDDVIDDSGYCFEDSEDGVDPVDYGDHDYNMPVYKTDIQKGESPCLVTFVTHYYLK